MAADRQGRALRPAGRVRRSRRCWWRRAPGARRRLPALGRAHALPGARHGRGHGHPRHAPAVPGPGRRPDRPGPGLADAVVDERGRLPVRHHRQAAVRPAGQHPDHLRADGAVQRLRRLLRHVGPERHAAALPPAVHATSASGGPPRTGSSSSSRRATRSSTWSGPASSWPRWAASSSRRSTKARRTERCRDRSSTCCWSWWR